MSSIFRKVLVSESLPNESGVYITESKVGLILKRYYDSDIKSFMYTNYNGLSRKCKNIEWWLEEIELPSKEEVDSYKVGKENPNKNDQLILNSWKSGANYILNKILDK